MTSNENNNIPDEYKFCDDCGECDPFHDECIRKQDFESYLKQFIKKEI